MIMLSSAAIFIEPDVGEILRQVGMKTSGANRVVRECFFVMCVYASEGRPCRYRS